MTGREGGCLCGAVRYRISVLVDHIDACHCQMCRRHTGGIGLGLEIPSDGIEWSGDENIGHYTSSEWAERAFCRNCGSGLYWRLKDDASAPETVSVYAGTLDDLNGLPLTLEVYVDHKPNGYAFAGQTKKMTQAEVEAAFAPEAGETK